LKMVVSVDDTPMPEPPPAVVHSTVTAVATNDAKPEEAVKEKAAEPTDEASSEPATEPGKKGKKAKAAKAEKPEKTKPEKHETVAAAESKPVVQTHFSTPMTEVDAGPLDAGAPDAGAPDAGPPDAGPHDAGLVITSATPDAGAPVVAESTANTGLWWIAGAVGLGVFGIVLVLGLRNRKRGF